MFAPMPAKPPLLLPSMVISVAPFTPLSVESMLLLNQPWDPFNRAQHEAHMNAWLMTYTDAANNTKLRQYANAYHDWHENAQRYADLGMSVPPPPAPPALDPVGPMPAGYWFK